jgi:hypothetical protein
VAQSRGKPPTRDEVLALKDEPWSVSKRGTDYINKFGYNIAVMKDHSDPDQWTWCLTKEGTTQGKWSDKKYSNEDDSKIAILTELRAKLAESR